MERELYSNGRHSYVYKVNSTDTLRFPQADLVRMDTTPDPHWHKRHFYFLKITELLFPHNIIQVVGATTNPPQEVAYFEDSYVPPRRFHTPRDYTLYSRKAPVSEAHAHFSKHALKKTNGSQEYTIQFPSDETDEVTIAKRHQHTHHSGLLFERAKEVAKEIQKTGIHVPYADPTDYCVTRGGAIIFFEIDGFDRRKVREYLTSLKHPTFAHSRALSLLDRADTLHARSRELAMQRKTEGITILSAG